MKKLKKNKKKDLLILVQQGSTSSSSNSGGGRQFNQMVSPSPSLTQPPVNDFHPIRRGSCVATISAKDYIGRF